ncbi:MAG: TetR/AcrR family transcriptional regulator [Rubrivivax sp.]|jgi:AcrR family transcriptional regulator|nr:TetR/AcrR family transcriptional regulator [Rubrivivax sp.]
MRLFAERGVTKVNVSQLASAAGMARGTIYSHVDDFDRLFEVVAGHLAHEMTERVVACMADVTDPAVRLATGVRQYIRRAHDEPPWGRFMIRFGLSDAVMRTVMRGDPQADFVAGIESGRYAVRRDQLPAMVAMLAGGTLAAMLPVLDGRGTWRDVGSDTVELMLVGLGLDRAEARAIATADLPPLPALD